MRNTQGRVESPNYPNDYPSSSNCGWFIDFGPGIYVKIEFTVFLLEEQSTCSFDYVSLHDGPNLTSPRLNGTTTYCGASKPPTTTHLGPLTVHFKSDKDTADKGFSAAYRTWGTSSTANTRYGRGIFNMASKFYQENMERSRGMSERVPMARFCTQTLSEIIRIKHLHANIVKTSRPNRNDFLLAGSNRDKHFRIVLFCDNRKATTRQQ